MANPSSKARLGRKFITHKCLFILVFGVAAGCAHQEHASDRSPASSQDVAGHDHEVKPGTEAGLIQTQSPSPKGNQATAEYHFSMAQAYVAEGNSDRAIEEFKLALMYDPKSSLIQARLASEYIKKGNFTSAMEACKEALQHDPKYIDARLLLAGLLSTTRNIDGAVAEYDHVLKDQPNHEEGNVYRAQLLMEENRVVEAVQGLKSFLKRNPESALAWYYMGRAEQKQEHSKEAMTAFQKAVDLRPSFGQAALGLAYMYESAHQNEKAKVVYRDLVDRTQDPIAANRLATILLREEKFKEAVVYLESVAVSDPEDMNVRVKLGLVKMELKDFDGAIKTFKAILAKNPDSDRIHYYLGSLYEELKQFDSAIQELKLVQTDSKLFTDATLHIAYLFKQGGKPEEAKNFMRAALEKAPKTASFYLFQATLEEESKNIGSAIEVLEKAVGLFPQEEKLRYYLGSLYDRQSQPDKALVQMEKILELNAGNVDALNYIGYTWTQQGVRLGDAEKLIKKALSLRPNNAYIQDSWGFLLLVKGRVQQATVELEKAAQLKPNEPTILEHLGDAYARSNLQEKALKKYEDAYKLADEGTFKKKLSLKLETIRQELANKDSPSKERVPAGQITH